MHLVWMVVCAFLFAVSNMWTVVLLSMASLSLDVDITFQAFKVFPSLFIGMGCIVLSFFLMLSEGFKEPDKEVKTPEYLKAHLTPRLIAAALVASGGYTALLLVVISSIQVMATVDLPSTGIVQIYISSFVFMLPTIWIYFRLWRTKKRLLGAFFGAYFH